MFTWEKYKRVFAFGCSFTQYTYPTWANIIFKEAVNAECYNFAKPGLGNLAISSKIAEANTRYNFSETDLVLVMYSVVYREDRYLGSSWLAAGNIFAEEVPIYDKNFVKKYADPIGYLVRDMSMIELSSNYVKNLPCDSLILMATDLIDRCDTVQDRKYMFSNINKVYANLLNSFPISMKEYLFPNGWEVRSRTKFLNRTIEDKHPTTYDYYKYLKHIGVNISDDTYQYVLDSEKKINEQIDIDRLTLFPECQNSKNNALY